MVDYNPANSNASDDARKLLNWLASLPDRGNNRVLSGQHMGGWDLTERYSVYVEPVYNETKAWIALIGVDYAWGVWNNPGQNSKIIDIWNDGALITISWHAYNPWTGNGLEWTGGTYTDTNIGDFADLYTSGNAAYDMWHADMDKKAEWLAELRDAGVVVLWRPFHEMNGGGRWWGGRDQTKFINNWKHMFDYFTDTKGLNNLLWVYGPMKEMSGVESVEYYYPGDDYVDIVGMSYYLWTDTLSNIGNEGYPELLDLGKVFALTEFGPSAHTCNEQEKELEPPADCYDYGTLPGEIQSHCPKSVYFLPWHSNWAMVNQRNVRELLKDPRVMTRDEVDWRSGPILKEIIIDDTDAGFSTSFSQDAWRKHTKDGGQHYGNSHYYNRKTGSGQDTATWSFTVPEPGNYDVYAWWWEGDWRPSDVPYTVNHFYGSTTVRKDQQADGGQWNLLGTFYWHDEGSIVVSDDVSSGRDIVADAIRLVYRSEGEKKTLREELEALRAKLEALNVAGVTAMLVHVDNVLAGLEELVRQGSTTGIA